MENEIELKTVDPSYQKQWDQVVDMAYNGTLFHKMKFLSYHTENKFDFKFLGVFKKDKMIGGLPYTLEGSVLTSPVGASYGGFFLKKSSLKRVNAIISTFLKWCKKNSIHLAKFTHAPLIYNEKISQDLDFILLYNNFTNFKNLFSSVVDLSYFKSGDPLDQLSDSGKRAIKKSKREGLEIKVHEDFKSFYPILVKNKRKFDVNPAHTLAELNALVELFPEKIKLISVLHQETEIAGVVTFQVNPQVLLTFYIASDDKYQEFRPVNYALFEAAKIAASQGFSYLDLGVSMNTAHDNPMEPAWNLVSFKEFLGSRGFLRSSYCWEIND